MIEEQLLIAVEKIERWQGLIAAELRYVVALTAETKRTKDSQ